ncbi:MAG: hypothetical protein RLZZ364_671 [Actinomycetota bacterium]|jgi:hypothetical protein
MAIEQFFNPDGTLSSIPARSSRKIELLNRLAQEFTVGVTYTERQINEILARFHEDTAALRRHMIEFGVMERNTKSEYWLS